MTTEFKGEALDLNKSRAEFEAWAREEWPDGSLAGVSIGDGWIYSDDVANDFWICWRAALARAGIAADAGQKEGAGEVDAKDAEPPSKKQEALRALADRIDHEQLWKHPAMYRDRLTDEQRDRLDAAVMLRRYSDLLAPGRWLLLPPEGCVQFSAGSLEKVTEMAKRDQERRAAQPKDTTDTRRDA